MKIIISNSDPRPIYEQITARIKNLIISGELKPGDALPSMRFLAKELRISVITTKRAYEELERGGFIETVRSPQRLNRSERASPCCAIPHISPGRKTPASSGIRPYS